MKIQVIVGSSRPGRVSDRVGQWVVNVAREAAGADVEVELVDLAGFDLPLFNEATPPRYNPDRQPVEGAKRFLDTLAQADGYVLVTPEYNRSTSGVLKNALDYIDFQFDRKPVAIVAHGSTGGATAVAHLRSIVPGLNAVSVPAATYFSDYAAQHISEQGELSDDLKQRPHGPQSALQTTVQDLVWYAKALQTARS